MKIKPENHIVIQGWMRTELNLGGNELMTYAIIYGFSQDGESKFTGSRQYLADWCGCSVRTIQSVLNSLSDRGLITKYEQTINEVKHCSYVANFTTSENFARAREKTALNNIEDNIGDISLSKDNDKKEKPQSDFESHGYSKDDFLGSAKRVTRPRPKRVSLYDKCIAEVTLFTQSVQLHTLLSQYLTIRLSMKDKPLYGVNQWKGMLNKLAEIVKDNPGTSYEEIVENSISNGWASFYPPKQFTRNKNKAFAEGDGLSNEQATDTEEERKENLRKTGRRTEF